MFITTFGPISTTWASFKTPQYCCWPTPSRYDHTSSEDKIICHVKAQIISNWVFEHDSKFNVTTKITRSQSNRALECSKIRVTPKMCNWQICRNYVMLSCQYGAKSQELFCTLLNLWNGELGQFSRQNSTSKILIKCLGMFPSAPRREA